VLFDIGFPPAFGKIHPKWKTPYVAILTQSAFATLFLFLSVLGDVVGRLGPVPLEEHSELPLCEA